MLCILAVAPAVADLLRMSRREVVRQADFIGVVWVRDTHFRFAAGEGGGGELAQEATVLVQKPIQGRSSPSALAVLFDNGSVCPNVQYESGATYLVFLRLVGGGQYVTVNHEQGRMRVVDGRVPYWREGEAEGLPLDEVAKEIRALAKEPKQP